jgi:N-acyl homoserine lactone hydrolase
MARLQLLISALCLTLAATGSPARADDAVTNVRLYAIDCGRIRVSDMSAFADTGELDGRPAVVVDSCFLVRHPKGTLLWDTGLSDKLVENDGSVRSGIFELSVKKGLIVRNTKARFIVQHDVSDFATLPRFPAFLE